MPWYILLLSCPAPAHKVWWPSEEFQGLYGSQKADIGLIFGLVLPYTNAFAPFGDLLLTFLVKPPNFPRIDFFSQSSKSIDFFVKVVHIPEVWWKNR